MNREQMDAHLLLLGWIPTKVPWGSMQVSNGDGVQFWCSVQGAVIRGSNGPYEYFAVTFSEFPEDKFWEFTRVIEHYHASTRAQ